MNLNLVTDIVAVILLITGFFFLTVGVVGVLRFPDFFTRLHAVGKSDTLGLLLSLSGLMVIEGLSLTTFKLLVVWIFLALGNPTATHILSRAALRAGLKPWLGTEGRS